MTSKKKKRKTVSLDADLHEMLQEDSNASATINKLVREYQYAGRTKEAAINRKIAEKETELEQARTEKARAESKIDRLQRELETLRTQLHSLTDMEQRQVDKVVELVTNGNLNKDKLTTDNDVILHRSDKAGMDAKRFVSEVEERI